MRTERHNAILERLARAQKLIETGKTGLSTEAQLCISEVAEAVYMLATTLWTSQSADPSATKKSSQGPPEIRHCLKLGEIASLQCPHCDSVPHIDRVDFPAAPDPHRSGPGLDVHLSCEQGHRWRIEFRDHSGGIWLDVFDELQRTAR